MKPTKSILALPLVLLLLPGLSACDEGNYKRDMILEYLDYVGIIQSIDRTTESMRLEYVAAYPSLPTAFWDDPRVVALFDNYKIGVLRSYTEALDDGLTYQELEFLVDFYSTEDARRAIALWQRIEPTMVATSLEAGREFSAEWTSLVEEGVD